MKKRLVFGLVAFLFFCGVSVAQESESKEPCNGSEFPEWVFSFPQEGQDGFFVVDSESLFNPINLRRDDAVAREWMEKNLPALIKALEREKEVRKLSIFRNSGGAACFEVEGTSEPDQEVMAEEPGEHQGSQELSQTRRKVGIGRKIVGTILGLAPVGLYLTGASPVAQLASGFVSAPLAERVMRPRVDSSEAPAGNRPAKSGSKDHDARGSFAALWR